MILSHLSQATLRPIRAVRTSVGLRYPQSQVRCQHVEADTSHLPRIIQPSIWESVFPKSLREQTKQVFKTPRKRSVNPASYFIWIYILIGSQAIRTLNIQTDFNTYMRKAELKIDKLREVVEKLQKGQSVDVEKVLGTGDEEQEQEWEEALKEIQNEERTWQENKRRRQEEQERLNAEQQNASPVREVEAEMEAIPDIPISLPRPPPSQPGFY